MSIGWFLSKKVINAFTNYGFPANTKSQKVQKPKIIIIPSY